jgi:hypothetical protein
MWNLNFFLSPPVFLWITFAKSANEIKLRFDLNSKGCSAERANLFQLQLTVDNILRAIMRKLFIVCILTERSVKWLNNSLKKVCWEMIDICYEALIFFFVCIKCTQMDDFQKRYQRIESYYYNIRIEKSFKVRQFKLRIYI